MCIVLCALHRFTIEHTPNQINTTYATLQITQGFPGPLENASQAHGGPRIPD